MATARERAEKAAKATMSHAAVWWVIQVAENAADAASDVWEPIVRELVGHMESVCEFQDKCDFVTKAKEALGDAR